MELEVIAYTRAALEAIRDALRPLGDITLRGQEVEARYVERSGGGCRWYELVITPPQRGEVVKPSELKEALRPAYPWGEPTLRGVAVLVVHSKAEFLARPLG